MFNRGQREVLNALSEQVFGVSSKWQSWQKEYKIQIGEVELPEAQQYVQISRKKGDNRPGQILKKEVAESFGYKAPEDKKVTKALWREATYDELVKQLVDMADYLRFSAMEHEARVTAIVYKEVHSLGLNFPVVKLTKQEREGYETDLTDLVNALPDSHRAGVVTFLEAPAEVGYEIDAVDFVSEFIFCLSHQEHAEEALKLSIEEADKVLKARRRMAARAQRR